MPSPKSRKTKSINKPSDDTAKLPWRIGGDDCKSIYFQGHCVGRVDSPGLAIILTTAANEREQREQYTVVPAKSRRRGRKPLAPSLGGDHVYTQGTCLCIVTAGCKEHFRT